MSRLQDHGWIVFLLVFSNIFHIFNSLFLKLGTGQCNKVLFFLQMMLQLNLIDLLSILIIHHKANILTSGKMAPKTQKSNPMLWARNNLTEHENSASRAQTLHFFLQVTFCHRTHVLTVALTLEIKIRTWALAGVAQWIEHRPANQRVTGSITSQGTCLRCGPASQ